MFVETIRIQTERLELIAATEELAKAEINNHTELSSLLRAQVPDAWPPEFNDLQTMTFTLQQLQGKPEQVGWWAWYFVLKGRSDGERVAIGYGGFKGLPDGSANVEVGYSIHKEYQRQGYGSEATAGLVNWAFEQDVRSVTAETLPELVASIGVLEKNDFVYMARFRRRRHSLSKRSTIKSSNKRANKALHPTAYSFGFRSYLTSSLRFRR
jgi:RimJ/RimL family protein N-acetyltransferase